MCVICWSQPIQKLWKKDRWLRWNLSMSACLQRWHKKKVSTGHIWSYYSGHIVTTGQYRIESSSNFINGDSKFWHKCVLSKLSIVCEALHHWTVGLIHAALFRNTVDGICCTLVLPVITNRLVVARGIHRNAGMWLVAKHFFRVRTIWPIHLI